MTMTATLSPLRRDRITGSRIAAVLGISPYASRDDAMRELVREHFNAEPEFTGNTATRHGQQHEADGIREYETAETVLVYGEQDIALHHEFDYLAHTCDGLVNDDGLVEIKAPLWGSYTSIDDTPWYFAQCMLGLECHEREWADFVVWRPGGITVSRITHDPTWLPGVQTELEDFLADYLSVIDREDLAAPFLTPLVDVRTDAEWADAAARWVELDALRRVAAARADAARDALVALAGEQSSRGGGVSVNVTERKGAIDMKRAVAENAPTVDLEQYRKPPTTVATVRGVLS